MKLSNWLLHCSFQILVLQRAEVFSKAQDGNEDFISAYPSVEANLGCSGDDPPCEFVTRISTVAENSKSQPSFQASSLNEETLGEVNPRSAFSPWAYSSKDRDARFALQSVNYLDEGLVDGPNVNRQAAEGAPESERLVTKDSATPVNETTPGVAITPGVEITPGVKTTPKVEITPKVDIADGDTTSPKTATYHSDTTTSGYAAETGKEQEAEDSNSCPVGDCSSFVTSNYISKGFTLTRYDKFGPLIDYVDKIVCSPGTTRLAMETEEEQIQLVTCLFCSEVSWFASQPKNHILTSGMVNLTNGGVPGMLPLEAVRQFGHWKYWETPMDPDIPSEVVLLDPSTGEEMISGTHLAPEEYAIVLIGTTSDSCISDTCPYSKWGLLSTRATKAAFEKVDITVCEQPRDETTSSPSSPTASEDHEPTTQEESTTTAVPTGGNTTDRTTSSSWQSSTTVRMTTTTKKVTTTVATDCCNVETGVSVWVCPGKEMRRSCPNDGYVGYQTVTCHPGQQLFVVEDRCVQKWINGIEDLIESGNYSAIDISSDVQTLTNQNASLTPNDLVTLIGVLRNLTALADQQSLETAFEEREDFLTKYNDDFVHITSNILSISFTWDLLHKEDAGSLGGSLLQILETAGFLLAGNVRNTTHRFSSSEVQMSVFATSRNSSEDVDLFLPDDRRTTSFRLPKDFRSLLKENNTQVRLVSFRVEQRSALRVLPAALNRDMEYGSYKEMNSPLISVSAGGVGQHINFTELQDLATIRFEHSFPEAGPTFRDLLREKRPGERATPVPLKATCVYWDTETGQWTPDGCYVINTTRDVTYCGCQHLTMFAILTDIHHYLGRDRVLDTLGTVLSSISCISLFIAFGIFQFYKSIASPRVSITKQLCVALGSAHLLLLFLLDRDFLKLSESACSVAAIALHYWLTASLFWMLAEGFHLLQTVSDVLSHASYMPAYWLLGYGVPAVVVMATLLVSYGQGHWSCQDAYAPPHSEYCWLSTEDGYIWMFTGPLIVVIILNTFNMMITLRTASTLRTNKQKTRGEQIRLWVKGSFSLNCLLGTTWVFGFLYINTGHIFAYIFTIFNASQGLMILILHCIVNDSVREAIVNSLPDRLSKYLKKQEPSQGHRRVAALSKEGSTPAVTLVRKANSSLTLRSVTPEGTPPTYSQKRRRIHPAQVDVSSPHPLRTVRHGSQQSNSTQMTFILDSLGNCTSGSSSSPESRRTSLDSFESTNSSNDEGSDLPSRTGEEVSMPWTTDSSRYIPGFAVILECEERSPRSERQVKFFQ